MSHAGRLPIDLGLVDISFDEMMFWMYLPVSIPGSYDLVLPDNVQPFAPLIREAIDHDPSAFYLRYAYLTAKTLWVSDGYIGNRPGWHIDGYGTEDINFIWSDRAATEFMETDVILSDDCEQSLKQMSAMGVLRDATQEITRYPNKHLLRLDNQVIHRSPKNFQEGMRTFFKLSLSRDRYNLRGNSINHALPATHWPLLDREAVRNHPATAEADSVKYD